MNTEHPAISYSTLLTVKHTERHKGPGHRDVAVGRDGCAGLAERLHTVGLNVYGLS